MLRDSKRILLVQPWHVSFSPRIGEIVLIEQSPKTTGCIAEQRKLSQAYDALARSVNIQTLNLDLILGALIRCILWKLDALEMNQWMYPK